MCLYIYIYMHWHIRGGTQKFLELLKKLFKAFVKVSNFSAIRSTPPATGCSNPSTAPNAGNIVYKSSTEMLSRAASESLAALDSISVGSGAGIAAYSRRGEYFEGH
jgi:hypothetical protein